MFLDYLTESEAANAGFEADFDGNTIAVFATETPGCIRTDLEDDSPENLERWSQTGQAGFDPDLSDYWDSFLDHAKVVGKAMRWERIYLRDCGQDCFIELRFDFDWDRWEFVRNLDPEDLV